MTLNVKLPAFYNEIILHWQEINNLIPKTKKGVLDQIIWNNSFIKINNVSIYFESWHQVGVTKLSSLVDEKKPWHLSFHEFSQKFKIKCNFLQFIGLTSTIPGKWKNYLKEENQTNTTNLGLVRTTPKNLVWCLQIKIENFVITNFFVFVIAFALETC